jgi:hypothetical protein
VYCLVGFIDRLRGKDPSYIEFKRAERIAVQTNENQNPGAEEYLELTNRAGFLITDQISIGALLDNPCLSSLVPVLSPTNSVIKLSPYQADLKRLRLDNHIALLKLCMPPEVYEANGLEMLEGYRMYGHDRISGAEEGWIGHIATESTRVHRFEEGKKK